MTKTEYYEFIFDYDDEKHLLTNHFKVDAVAKKYDITL